MGEENEVWNIYMGIGFEIGIEKGIWEYFNIELLENISIQGCYE